MRLAFCRALMELAGEDPRIVLLTGDLGYNVLEPFAEAFPARFFNVGVAEQNMIGMATGLAEGGFIPCVYSIATFASLRPYEFIRNGPVLQQLRVRIAAVGGGFEYGHAGPTHHALEDLGVMRIQPGLTVVSPADHQQARAAVIATWGLPGPVYYRLGKDDTTVVPELQGRFRLGRVEVVADGDDLLLISAGPIASEAARAAKTLREDGISTMVAVVSSFNPIPVEDLADILERFPLALTVEAHYVTGGLGSLVSEVIAERGLTCRLVRCGVRTLSPVSGNQEYLHQMHGLSSDSVVKTARAALGRPSVG
jgi:transketolase